MPASGPWKILVQAGHLAPRQPGATLNQTGTNGEIEFGKKVRDAVVTRLRADPHFEPIPMPGAIPWGIKCDAAIFLHCDGVTNQSATGISFGFSEHYPVNKRLADLIWHEFEQIPGHPVRRRDNGTKDEHFYYGFRLVDTPGPETLIEHGFLTNPGERRWMNANIDNIAKAEYTAICRFFGVAPLGDGGGGGEVHVDLGVGAQAHVHAATSLQDAASEAGASLGQLHDGATVVVEAVPANPVWRRVHITGFVKKADITLHAAPTELSPSSALIARPRAKRAVLESYVLGRRHSVTDDQVRKVVGAYATHCVATGLDPLLTVSQMVLETGNLTSGHSQPPQRNLAGIGITGASGGVKFANYEKAVRAHVGRVLRYALPEGGETPDQLELIREALAVRALPKGFWGSAPELRGLAGAWAADAAYATKISNIANSILGQVPHELFPSRHAEELVGVG